MQEDPDLVDFNQISPELSRSWRGLRAWLPIKMHGIGPFRANLDEKLDLAAWAAEELRKIPGIEILAEPQLSIVAFRWRGEGHDDEALNRINRDLLERINAKKRDLPDRDDAGGPLTPTLSRRGREKRPLRHPHLRSLFPNACRAHARGDGGHPRGRRRDRDYRLALK